MRLPALPALWSAVLGAAACLVVAASEAAPSPAFAKEMAALIGKPFSATRAKLLAEGWAPVETNLTNSRGESERSRGEAARFLEAGFPEIERCTGGAKNYCFFNYKRRGQCLRVRTLGVLELPASDPRVHGAGDACPSRQKAPG
ncbi:MAG: hypothetical protein JNJ89_02520 [Rubrivivax sp.]|nr:hypothetical protein [Rubrivivax sp.]